MKKLIIVVLLSCACLSGQAQLNFVLNGSFEQHTHCPWDADQIKYANYWNSIDTSWSPGDTIIVATHPQCLPEYINTCGTGICTAPVNGGFYQYPRTGNGMAQSEVYYDYGYPGLDQYNYLQGRLVNHLTAGQSYCVTFFANKANSGYISINKIGAYLDNGTIDTASRCAIPQSQYTPQILDTNVITDTLAWTKIQGSFIANGTERFITIGDFFDTGNVTKIYPTFGTNHIGLYLFDDVSVIASNAVAFAGRDTAIKPGDTVSIGATINGDGMPCWWYVLGNTVPIDSGGTIRVHPASNTTYVVKMDLCGNITYDTVTVKVWPASVVNYKLSIINCKLYPNPATGEVTIDGAKDCQVVFYDVVGKAVASYVSMTNQEVFDIAILPKGVYSVQVVDKLTGERVMKKMLKE